MIINLNNYEELLTMYVDNELSAADRERVEAFLREYPYLQGELDMLEQTKLAPEKIGFFNKASLLKPILSEEEESKLLLHLDGELNKKEAHQLETEISVNSLLNKEWQLLQKTKLDVADRIEFPYKEELYRNERSRVVRMPFLRWAAAAIVIGVGFYLGAGFFKSTGNDVATNEVARNNSSTVTPVQNTTNNQKAVNVNEAQKENTPVTNQSTDALNQQYAVNTQTNQKVNTTQVNTNNTKEKQGTINPVQPKESFAGVQPQKDVRNSPIMNDKVINREEPILSENEIAALLPKNSGNSPALNEVSATPKMNRPVIEGNIHPVQSGYAQTASLNFESSDNSVFLMDEENISRSKAGILLKKLKRNVERRANIKPGKSLRIAGFEFAVK